MPVCICGKRTRLDGGCPVPSCLRMLCFSACIVQRSHGFKHDFARLSVACVIIHYPGRLIVILERVLLSFLLSPRHTAPSCDVLTLSHDLCSSPNLRYLLIFSMFTLPLLFHLFSLLFFSLLFSSLLFSALLFSSLLVSSRLLFLLLFLLSLLFLFYANY